MLLSKFYYFKHISHTKLLLYINYYYIVINHAKLCGRSIMEFSHLAVSYLTRTLFGQWLVACSLRSFNHDTS